MKKRFTAIILVSVMVFHMGCSSAGTTQNASSGQASSEAQTAETAETADTDTAETDTVPEESVKEPALTNEQEKAYRLYAKKVQELEEAYGPMTVDLYGYGVPDEDWRYAHGLMLLKLMDFDEDGIEELATVFSHEGESPELRIYTTRDDRLVGLQAAGVGGGGSPVIFQIGFGMHERKPAIFHQAGSAVCYVYTYDDGQFRVTGEIERKEGLVFNENGVSYKLPGAATEETYYFTYDTEESLSYTDHLCATTNETRALLGLTDDATYEVRDASKERFLFQAALRGNTKVRLDENGETVEYVLTNDYRFPYIEGRRNLAFLDINDDGKEEMLIRVDDHYLRVFVAQDMGVFELLTPFYSGSKTEEICEDGTLYMFDDTHPGREVYVLAALNKENEMEQRAILSREYPDPMYAVPEETFSIERNGQKESLTKAEFEQMKKELEGHTITPDYKPLPDLSVESPVSAVDLVKMTAGEVLEVLGDEYFYFFYSGFGYMYPDTGIVFAPLAYDVRTFTAEPDSALTSVSVHSQYEVLPGLRGACTWPEMKRALDAASVKASAPVKYYDEHDGMDLYNCLFAYDGCEISCYWDEDPETNPCYQILVKPGNI